MPRNDFERLCSLYLRLNGFFHITNFTVHYVERNPEEIDFIGIRFPKSSEKPMKEDGSFEDRHPFRDDDKLLEALDDSKLITLIGEATISPYRSEIAERINKLRNPLRTKYALQRFGILDEGTLKKIVNKNSDMFSLLRILFVLSDKCVPRENIEGIKWLTYSHVSSFILERANDVYKIRGVQLLPEGFQNFVTFVRTLKI